MALSFELHGSYYYGAWKLYPWCWGTNGNHSNIRCCQAWHSISPYLLSSQTIPFHLMGADRRHKLLGQCLQCRELRYRRWIPNLGNPPQNLLSEPEEALAIPKTAYCKQNTDRWLKTRGALWSWRSQQDSAGYHSWLSEFRMLTIRICW